MTDQAIPKGTHSSFPPGTPLSLVRAHRDEMFAAACGRLSRIKELASELADSGEFEIRKAGNERNKKRGR